MLLAECGSVQCRKFGWSEGLRERTHHVEYAVPSLEIAFDDECTSSMPGSCWSTVSSTSSCFGSQFASCVIGSLGSSLRYPPDTRSSSDCGAFCLSRVYWEISLRSSNKSLRRTASRALTTDWV